MGLNWRQFELGLLRPTLKGEPEVAIKLVGESLFHESDHLRALGQYPRDPDAVFGPGLGIASVEEPTWDWMVEEACKARWIRHPFADALVVHKVEYHQLAYDLRLNILACRFRYKLDRRALPKLEDGIEARATTWWSIYNGGQVDRRPKYIQDARMIPWTK